MKKENKSIKTKSILNATNVAAGIKKYSGRIFSINTMIKAVSKRLPSLGLVWFASAPGVSFFSSSLWSLLAVIQLQYKRFNE